ncbi:MAG: hypothetical protein CL583_13545, partial [Alteromonadaceae bacterium]|nr:hypothetical protein [Alteromonadaceae bacterium]
THTNCLTVLLKSARRFVCLVEVAYSTAFLGGVNVFFAEFTNLQIWRPPGRASLLLLLNRDRHSTLMETLVNSFLSTH